jgi:hypothetical protein
MGSAVFATHPPQKEIEEKDFVNAVLHLSVI